MGAAVLVILAGLEIGFGVWTLIGQREMSAWRKGRLVIRGMQFGVVLSVFLSPAGNIGLRFFGVLLLLGIRLLIAGAGYLRKRKEAGIRGRVCSVLSTVAGCLLMAFFLIPAFIFSGYQGLKTTGGYEVEMVQAILTDKSRIESFESDGSCREVPIYLFYPVGKEVSGKNAAERKNGSEKGKNDPAEGNFPLVIFSHGAFGYYQSNTSTYMELASHGYVVVSLDHPHHSFVTKDTSGKTITVDPQFIRNSMYLGSAEDGEVSEEEIFRTTREWVELRVEDIGFVLDEIKEQAEAVKRGNFEADPDWYIKKASDARPVEKVLECIDTGKIGVMGHSLGGAASVTIGRIRDDVDAVIDLDGTALGEELSYENDMYRYYEGKYPAPLLMISSESHQAAMDRYGTDYVNMAVLANAKDGRYTYFVGSGHMNFTDLPLFSPFLASKLGTGSIDAKKCIETMNGIILQFFDHYLKDAGELQILEKYSCNEER